MQRPEVVSLDELAAELSRAAGGAYVWALPRFRARAEERLRVPEVS